MRVPIVIISLVLLAVGVPCATLLWDRNPEPEVCGYKVHQGRSSRVYEFVFDAGNETNFTIKPFPGTNYFAVTAYTDDGRESELSDEVWFVPLTLTIWARVVPESPQKFFRLVESTNASGPWTDAGPLSISR